MEKLRIRFDGKIASTGKMHFYEYGRYQYATARFLSTLEYFRRTGEVADRIVGSSKIEIYVSTPQEGSFLEEILIPELTETVAAGISTSLTTLISYVWSLILPRDTKTDSDLIKMAEIQLALSGEETKKFEVLERIVSGGYANNMEALQIIDKALKSGSQRYGDEDLLSPRLLQMQNELVTESQREKLFQEEILELEKIDDETKRKLVSRLSTIAKDMAVPIRRSADTIELRSSKASHPILILDEHNSKRISTTKLEPNETVIVGRVKSYDRDAGVGKIVSNQLDRPLNFPVSPNFRNRWRDTILEAMRRDTIELTCHRYVDRGGMPSSLLFVGINLLYTRSHWNSDKGVD